MHSFHYLKYKMTPRWWVNFRYSLSYVRDIVGFVREYGLFTSWIFLSNWQDRIMTSEERRTLLDISYASPKGQAELKRLEELPLCIDEYYPDFGSADFETVAARVRGRTPRW